MGANQARRVIAWTATHYHAADETTLSLPAMVTDCDNCPRWDRQLDVPPPPSGDALTNHNREERLMISNIMEMLLKSDVAPDHDPDDGYGLPEVSLAGTHHRYSLYPEPVSDSIHDDILSVPKWVEHLETDERIVTIIDIADEFMKMSQGTKED